MKKLRNNSHRASTLSIALSIGLISISAILLVIAAPANLEKAPQHDRSGFQLEESGDSITALGNYPDTSISLSSDTTVTPDAAPTNTTSINVSTSTNFNGRLEGDPATGVVRVTDAHPGGTYMVTVRAFNGSGSPTTATFTLTVTTTPSCTPLNFAAPRSLDTDFEPVSVAVGDFNGDGMQDLVVANHAGSTGHGVWILLGDGAGNFSAATYFEAGGFPTSVAVGDFNGDGKQDLATANLTSAFESDNVSVFLGDGAGIFGVPANFVVGQNAESIAVGDFNGDGKQDLVVANNASSSPHGVWILLGDGAGNFSPATFFNTGYAVYVALGDFNSDGKQDLAVVNNQGTGGSFVAVLLGDGAGGFGAATNFGVGFQAQSVAVGDFNGDGKQDLAVVNEGNNGNSNVSVLLGDGTGNFSSAGTFDAGYVSRSVAVGDFNGDGKQDLVVANEGSDSVSVLLGDGAGNFSAPNNFSAGVSPVSVAAGDFNSDGMQDLAVANYYGSNASVLLRICVASTPTPTPTPTPTSTATASPAPSPTPTPTPCVNYAYTLSTGAIVPGTTNTGNSCDDCSTSVFLPFSYQLYDTVFNRVFVGSNGHLTFGAINNSFSASCIPQAVTTYAIFPYRTDLCTGPCAPYNTGSNLGIFTSISGSAPNRVFNIEWRAAYYFWTPTTNIPLNFEVRLYEGQTAFDLVYGTITPKSTANDGPLSVGVQKNTSFYTLEGCDPTGGTSPPVSSGQVYHYTLGNGCPIATPSPSPTPTATATASPAPTATATASPTPPSGCESNPFLPPPMSGNVYYCSTSAPVPGVTIRCQDFCGFVGTTTTDSSGFYVIGLPSFCKSGNGGFLTPSQADRIPGSPGISTIDVVAVQRHFLIIGPPLSGCRLTAGDVNGDGSINTTDVVAIQRFFLGFSTGIANVGRYQFNPPNACFNSFNSHQDFSTIIFGDVATPFIY